MSDFITWLAEELERRNLSHRKLAKKAGLSNSLVSKVLAKEVPVSCDFCIKVAEALDESPEEFLRMAGILPAKTSESDIEELVNLFESLSSEKKKALLEFLRILKGR